MRSRTNRRSFLKASASLSLASLAPGTKALQAFASVLPIADPNTPSPSATIGHPLMAPNLAHSLAERCLSKPVFAQHLLDDMESDKGWIASPVINLSYTKERAKLGTQSMRFRTQMRNEDFIRSNQTNSGHFTGDEAAFVGQPFSASAILNFDTPLDWSAFNRISLWCYLHPTRITTTSISLQFLCHGASAGPWDPLPIHFIGDLKPGEWNHLTWEISEYPRNKVVQFILFKPTSGVSLSVAEPEIAFDLDQLQLERVDVEPVSGWAVTPGKISYSHFGYRAAANKLAYCSDSDAESFSVLNAGQLQWVVGANPFSRSLIFGVGYDYWQNFTVDNINFVGGMGLGMNSYQADAPAWPNNAVFPYKEQWSYSTSRIAINLAQCAAPARIKGHTASAIVLREQRTGETVHLEPGPFDRALTAGSYRATSRGMEWNLELVGGRTYEFTFDPAHAVNLSLEVTCTDANVTVHAKLRGNGSHAIELKLFNLAGAETKKQFELKDGADLHLNWQFKVIDRNTPWVVVATPDSATELRQELFGRVGIYATLS